MLSISDDQYHQFRRYLQNVAGIDLGGNKQYLLATRIRKVLAAHQLANFDQLLAAIRSANRDRLKADIIEAMVTNETGWFRDQYPFDYLRFTLLPHFSQRKSVDPLKIWSCACSTGQEPYSISMVVEEFAQSPFGKSKMVVDILASDLSGRALAKARQGMYCESAISRGLSDERKKAYFSEQKGKSWKVSTQLSRRVTFEQLNLLKKFDEVNYFDIVFCRNVLIYFSQELKSRVLKNLHQSMRPGAYLFLGASENIADVSDLFDLVQCEPGVVCRVKK